MNCARILDQLCSVAISMLVLAVCNRVVMWPRLEDGGVDYGMLAGGHWSAGFWKMDFKFCAGSPTSSTLLKVGRAAGPLMLLSCNWIFSSETCELRPKQFRWITRSPLGWTIVMFIACWFGRWPNMKNSQQEHAWNIGNHIWMMLAAQRCFKWSCENW